MLQKIIYFEIDAKAGFNSIHDLVKDFTALIMAGPHLIRRSCLSCCLSARVRSERQLMREVQVNAAYRWFLGLSLTDKVPDASTPASIELAASKDSLFTKIFLMNHLPSDEECQHCPVLMECTQNKKYAKTVTQHIREESKEHINAHCLTNHGRAVYKRREETLERSFADAKQLHGYCYARFRRLSKVKQQCLMTAAAQNIKNIELVIVQGWKMAYI